MADLLKEVKKEDYLIKECASKVFSVILRDHDKNKIFPLEFILNEEIRKTPDPTSFYHFIKFFYKNVRGYGGILYKDSLTLGDEDAIASSYVKNIINFLEKYHKCTFEIFGINIEYADNSNTFKAQKIIKV